MIRGSRGGGAGGDGGDGGSEGGFATVQYVAAVGMALVLLVVVANVLVDLYARAAVRAALDEGVRAAAPVDAPAEACATRAAETLDALLHGNLRDTVTFDCRADADGVVAEAEVVLDGWIAGVVPAWHLTLEATAERER